MKKTFLCLVFALFLSYVQAQTKADEIENDKEFTSFIQNYKEFLTTKEFDILPEFWKAVGNEYNHDTPFDEWIKKNLHKTPYKSINEGLTHYTQYETAYKEWVNISKKLKNQESKLRQKYDKKLFEDAYQKQIAETIM